jgi:hypothetical protein
MGHSSQNLLEPARLWTRIEVLARDCPMPRQAGIYGWYFKSLPPRVPHRGCHRTQGATLLYVGISPKQPPANGAPPSRQHLLRRIRYHFRGNACGSTLRLTLGCLLAARLGIALRRVGSGARYTFADGEARLSDWMQENAFVCYLTHPMPWLLEAQLIAKMSLPLNLQGNTGHPFHQALSALRRAQRVKADELPVWQPDR